MSNIKSIIIASSLAASAVFSMNVVADSVGLVQAMGAKVISVTPSSATGYKAIMAEKDGKRRMFYETPDGQYLLYGLIYDNKGNSITSMDALAISNNKQPESLKPSAAAQKQASAQPQAVAVDANIAFTQAKSANWVSEGKGNNVYVVFDPNCPYCKELHNETRKYLSTSKIHWIPVGVLNQDSANKSAKILLSNNAAEIKIISAGGYRTDKPSKELQVKLDKNLQVLTASQSNSVPVIIYKDKTGNPKVVQGLPPVEDVKKIFENK